MHKPALSPIIYAWLFPNPKPTDPSNFQTYISKQLVPEVRAETARFYGHIDCVEAQYPGLDYAVAAHRLRLGRFPYHRRLFQVFDQLRLTNHEIQSLCKWEGTRWARERYERDVGIKVRETTWDDVALAVPEPPTVTVTEPRQGVDLSLFTQHRPSQDVHSANNVDATEILAQNTRGGQSQLADFEEEDEEEEEEEEKEEEEEGDRGSSDEEEGNAEEEPEESDDELQQSVGVELNQRLMAATEARNRGEEVVLDADWEQWLKEAAERGGIPDVTVANNVARAYAGSASAWAPQLPGTFETGSTRLLSPSFAISTATNPTLDGSSAPPTGTAM